MKEMARSSTRYSVRNDLNHTDKAARFECSAPQRIAEVEDFVDFLLAREDANEQRLTLAATKAREPCFAQAWNNDKEAAAYDRL